MAKTEYTVKSFLDKENGESVDFYSITQEEKKDVFASWRKRLSENMSRYYSQHLDEYEKL
ncbi:MAG: hypothetical protein IJ491_01995 [Clostridia bacterium]|nr:hypothetical protein [Clostridia bacterium]